MPLSGASLPRELAAVVSAVNAMLQAIDRALTRQREFAADAAHELRTPLAVLRLQIAELPRGPVVQQLDEELAALGRLIEQLLRFAQAEQVMADRRQTMDVVAVARQTCEDLAPLAFARQQELEFVAPEAPVLRAGNPTLLGVAIRNLIENALRAAPVATTVTVSVGDPGVVVEDRGPGVPDAQKQAIFRRLWRGDPGRTEGAGIGLALVERIAELHEGSVEVEDRPGGGARFVLHLAEGAPSA
jgi:signal transduction histidine kinase